MAKQNVIVQLRYNGVWNTVTSDVLVRDGITITRGKADEFEQPPPANATLTFRGHDYNPRNPSSPLHGLIGRNTPILIAVGADIRFIGEVSSWTPRQSLGGPNSQPDRWVFVEAAGITRRLGQGTDPLREAPARFVDQNRDQLIGYWPLTDPQGSTIGRSGVAGPAMRPVGDLFDAAPFGQGQLAPWLPASAQTSGAVGRMRATGLRGAPGGWVLDFMYRTPAPGTWGEDWPQQLDVVVRDEGAGPSDEVAWRVNFIPANEALDLGDTPNVIELLVVVTGSPPTSSSVAFPDSLRDGQPHHIRLRAFEQSGTSATLFVDVDGVNVGFVTNSNIGTTAIQPPTEVSFEWTTLLNAAGDTIATLPVTFGQVAMWNETVPGLTDSLTAYFGHQGEPAGRRIERLCDEQGVPFLAFFGSDLDDTVPVGPQYPDGFVTLLQEAADVDRGHLIDGETLIGDQLALKYRPHRTLYNQTAALALDYDAGEVAPPFEPVIDDQATRNDITAQRRDGGQARAVDEASVAEVGRYTDSGTVNVMSDDMLADQVSWRLHLGTLDETRYPQVSIDLGASPGLVAAVDLLDLASRITISNLPASITPDLASLLLVGWTEVVQSHRRVITFNCVPESTYHIAEVEHTDYGIIQSDTANLAEDLTTTETDVTIDPGAAGLWVHEVDFDIVIGGERMSVTGVGPSVLDTFSRTVVDGWGSTDTGEIWTLDGAAADFDVTGSVGTIVGSAGAGQHAVFGTYTEVELLCKAQASTLNGEISLTARWSSASDRYTFELDLDAGSQSVDIWRRVAGVATNLATVPFTFAAATWYWVRVQCRGASLLVKVWQDGAAEPVGWTLSASDSSHASGAVGCGAFNAAGVKSFDDFQVLNPQTLTVIRSVNGVVKQHESDVNDRVEFFHKSYIGL